MAERRTIEVGRIRYEITFVANPAYRGGRPAIFSDELHARIRRRNVPAWRVVEFDGRHARAEEINADYGVVSRSVELRTAGSATITYCKELRNLGFCIDYEAPVPIGGPPPYLRPTGETETIAGFLCSKGEYVGRHLYVWYTGEVAVSDTTGAVLRLDGVPGLILRTEQMPNPSDDSLKRVSVVEISPDAHAPGTFAAPQDYRRFASVDEARAEDRRLLDAKARDELRAHPPGARDRGALAGAYAGTWRYTTAKDAIEMKVMSTRDGLRLRTVVLTAPAGAPGRVTDEKASIRGRLLMVEDPPNYRLYSVSDDGQTLVELGNDLFRFTRR